MPPSPAWVRARADALCAKIGRPKGYDIHGENTVEVLALINDKLEGRFTYENVTYNFQQENRKGKETRLVFHKCDDKGRRKRRKITEGDFDKDPEALKKKRKLNLESGTRRRDRNEVRTGCRRTKGYDKNQGKDADVQKFEFMNECQEQSTNGEADKAMDRLAELGDFPTSFRHDHPNRKSFWQGRAHRPVRRLGPGPGRGRHRGRLLDGLLPRRSASVPSPYLSEAKSKTFRVENPRPGRKRGDMRGGLRNHNNTMYT